MNRYHLEDLVEDEANELNHAFLPSKTKARSGSWKNIRLLGGILGNSPEIETVKAKKAPDTESVWTQLLSSNTSPPRSASSDSGIKVASSSSSPFPSQNKDSRWTNWRNSLSKKSSGSSSFSDCSFESSASDPFLHCEDETALESENVVELAPVRLHMEVGKDQSARNISSASQHVQSQKNISDAKINEPKLILQRNSCTSKSNVKLQTRIDLSAAVKKLERQNSQERQLSILTAPPSYLKNNLKKYKATNSQHCFESDPLHADLLEEFSTSPNFDREGIRDYEEAQDPSTLPQSLQNFAHSKKKAPTPKSDDAHKSINVMENHNNLIDRDIKCNKARIQSCNEILDLLSQLQTCNFDKDEEEQLLDEEVQNLISLQESSQILLPK